MCIVAYLEADHRDAGESASEKIPEGVANVFHLQLISLLLCSALLKTKQ